MSKIQGIHILEVWDFRLSTATPLIVREGKTWRVQIWSKENPDHDPARPETLSSPLEEYDTGISSEKGDHRDRKKLMACYEWLHSVRDKYARADIEAIKPAVRKLREAEKELHAAMSGGGV